MAIFEADIKHLGASHEPLRNRSLGYVRLHVLFWAIIWLQICSALQLVQRRRRLPVRIFRLPDTSHLLFSHALSSRAAFHPKATNLDRPSCVLSSSPGFTSPDGADWLESSSHGASHWLQHTFSTKDKLRSRRLWIYTLSFERINWEAEMFPLLRRQRGSWIDGIDDLVPNFMSLCLKATGIY
jgi:hypothetical protein